MAKKDSEPNVNVTGMAGVETIRPGVCPTCKRSAPVADVATSDLLADIREYLGRNDHPLKLVNRHEAADLLRRCADALDE